MEIKYNNYPTLLFTSFLKDDAPSELPFEVVSEDVRNYLAGCKGFSDMFALIAAKNTVKNSNSNRYYYLNDSLFKDVDSNDYFRNRYFADFFTENIKPKHGVILFKDSGQYVYMLLGGHETKKLKGVNGRYIAVALFRENFFIGFEEGYIKEDGIQVAPTGNYENGMNVGGYISFVLITLGYAGDKPHPLVGTSTKENIFLLS